MHTLTERVEVFYSVRQATSGMNDWNSSISHGVKLVEPTWLKSAVQGTHKQLCTTDLQQALKDGKQCSSAGSVTYTLPGWHQQDVGCSHHLPG